MLKKIYLLILVTVILTIAINSAIGFFNVERPGQNTEKLDAMDALSRYGSKGAEVKKIQIKLKKWKYFFGSIDGKYGSKTRTAVRKFQKKYNILADGIAGPKTLKKMGIQSSSSSRGNGSYSRNVDLLSHLIHGESRGEPYLGMVAVGAVVLNRIQDSRFPKTIPSVIYAPGAFVAVSDGQINLPPSDMSIKAAREALNGWDPTSGCIYYYNPVTATSKWIWSRPIMLKIGKHNFAK